MHCVLGVGALPVQGYPTGADLPCAAVDGVEGVFWTDAVNHCPIIPIVGVHCQHLVRGTTGKSLNREQLLWHELLLQPSFNSHNLPIVRILVLQYTAQWKCINKENWGRKDWRHNARMEKKKTNITVIIMVMVMGTPRPQSIFTHATLSNCSNTSVSSKKNGNVSFLTQSGNGWWMREAGSPTKTLADF